MNVQSDDKTTGAVSAPHVAGAVSAEKTAGTMDAPHVLGSTSTEAALVGKSEQSNIVDPPQSTQLESTNHFEEDKLDSNSHGPSSLKISQQYKDEADLRLKESQTKQALADAITKKLSLIVSMASCLISIAIFVVGAKIQRQADMADKNIDKLITETNKQKHDLLVSRQQQRSKIHIDIIPSVIIIQQGDSVRKAETMKKKYVKIEGKIQNDGLLDAVLDIGAAKCFIGKITDTTTDIDDNGRAFLKIDAARPVDWGRMLDGKPIGKLWLFSGEKESFVGIREIVDSGVYLITVSIPYCNTIIASDPDALTKIDSTSCTGAESEIALSSRTVARSIVVVE